MTPVELNEDFTRAWIDGIELKPGTYMVVTVQRARAMGVLNSTPIPCGTTHVFMYHGGFALLERV